MGFVPKSVCVTVEMCLFVSEVIMMGPAVSMEAQEYIYIVMGPAESMQYIAILQFIL
jgi:hypothetical protein